MLLNNAHCAFKNPHAQSTNISKMKANLCYYGNYTDNEWWQFITSWFSAVPESTVGVKTFKEEFQWELFFCSVSNFCPQTLSCFLAATATWMFPPPTSFLWPFCSQLTPIYLSLLWVNNNGQQTGGRARANTSSTAPSFDIAGTHVFPHRL